MYGQFLALFASFMWASSSILYKKALVKFSPSILNTIRPLTALLFLSVVLIYEEEFLNLFSHSQKTYLLTFLTAIFGLLLGDFFYLSSIKLIGVSRALPLASITPLIVALISHFYLKEIITLNLIVGTFLILLGIYLITEENKKQEKMKKGILFAFLAALFWALYVVISKVALEEIRPIAFNIIRMFFFSSIMVFHTFFIKKRKLSSFKEKVLLWAMLGAIIDLGIGTVAMFQALRVIEASKAAPFTATTPVFATILAIIFTDERITRRIVFGVLSTTLGIIFVIST